MWNSSCPCQFYSSQLLVISSVQISSGCLFVLQHFVEGLSDSAAPLFWALLLIWHINSILRAIDASGDMLSIVIHDRFPEHTVFYSYSSAIGFSLTFILAI